MKLKVVGIEYNATIRNVRKGVKEIVTLEEIRKIPEMQEKLGEGANLKKIQEVAQLNEKSKVIKMAAFKKGEKFKIVIRKIVMDQDD